MSVLDGYYLANGVRIEAGGELFDVHSPWTGELVASVRAPSAADVGAIVARAADEIPSTSAIHPSERAAILTRIADAIEGRRSTFTELLSLETGKTLRDCGAELDRVLAILRLCASLALGVVSKRFPIGRDDQPTEYMIGHPTPIGVVAAIPAFNYPLVIAAHKVGPAIAAGCPFVLKPSEKTPLTALLLGEVIVEAGWPRPAVSVLPGDHRVGAALVTHPDVKLISFTGSTEVGQIIAKQAGVAKVVLELGSNAPTIVLPDADLDHVARRVAQGGYVANGQSCISVQRLVVQESVHDELVSRLTTLVHRLRAGDPADPATDVGPVIDDKSAARIQGLIEDAVRRGATVHVGGGRAGRMIEPTLLSGLRPDMRLSTEEVFGPVVAVARFSTLDEAVALANATPYGLQAGVFSDDRDAIEFLIARLQFGGIHINEISTFRPDGMPYGGVKASGIGKEGPRSSIEDMLNYKMVTALEGSAS